MSFVVYSFWTVNTRYCFSFDQSSTVPKSLFLVMPKHPWEHEHKTLVTGNYQLLYSLMSMKEF